ncbi:MAG: S26 family signal peptidase, partial [Candidatus Aminicenantes bacterium]|nr:S26 family signal peptidase [Candidatus Aminicenantes bacterium]
MIEYDFTSIDPNDLYRRKGEPFVYDDYFPSGKLLNPWMNSINEPDFQFLYIDDKPISEIVYYIVEQDYYWAMGDNRDDSLDSRF